MEEQELPFNPNIDKELIISILNEFAETVNYEVPEQDWFNSLKALAAKYGFAENAKTYKKNRELYKGHVGDVAEMVRIALTSSKQSPNIYYVLRILKIDEIRNRIQKTISLIK
jgi:glutamyl-tRNA synthetase